MARRNVPGTTYLLHLDPPLRHARHYLGFAEADDLDSRLADHGGPHGARLLAAQKAAGGTWHLARTWPGTTRAFERQIKNTRHVPHYCPECQPRRATARRADRTSKAAAQAAPARKEPDVKILGRNYIAQPATEAQEVPEPDVSADFLLEQHVQALADETGRGALLTSDRSSRYLTPRSADREAG